ncbi:hypothetical protein [uncultured Dysgonomonas sp.]|uniref:Uncharacterized protein n=1 Tax=uncultured Dysgonomonas sp. TaxID=206096 RepID=A0A212IV55_9BACT|nr:hypothetical protein [uncultured Dysgonomonas sp.]SBV91077.1 conserved exported hypothetical protein [uncultured Dysgonomonas sp.]
MKKFLFSAVVLLAMAFTAQNAHAQAGLQLTSSVQSFNLGTVHVGDVIPIQLDLKFLNLGILTPNIASMQVKSTGAKIRIRQGDVVALPTGVTDWIFNDGELDIIIIAPGALNESLEVSVEVPLPLLPPAVLTLDIPVTGTVLP